MKESEVVDKKVVSDEEKKKLEAAVLRKDKKKWHKQKSTAETEKAGAK